MQIVGIDCNLIRLRTLRNFHFLNWFGSILLGKILRIDANSKF